MVVRTQSRGRAVSGLLVEAEDVKRFFPDRVSGIELQLGELRIHCQLGADFWNGRFEIADRRLCDWLEFKAFHGRPCRRPLSLELTPAGVGAFRLQAPAECDFMTCNWPDQIAEGCPILSGPIDAPPLEAFSDREWVGSGLKETPLL